SATPATIPSTSPAPSASARVMPDGPLTAGTYAVQPYIGAAADVTLTVTVPAGWQGAAPAAVIGPNNTEAPLGAAVIFLQADGVFADPCRWDTARTGNPAQAGG